MKCRLPAMMTLIGQKESNTKPELSSDFNALLHMYHVQKIKK